MYDIIEQIRDDHISIAKVLAVIGNELSGTAEDPTLDYDLLCDCMRYMIEYVDTVHHPKEDAMMQCSSMMISDLSELVPVIMRQHQSNGKLSARFYELVKRAKRGETVDQGEIVETGLDYIKKQREHIDLEEGKLLKGIRSILLHDDYLQINRQYEDYRDPILSESFESEYKALHNSLVS